MTAFVALLRAVNVGGTGKLPMSDLKAMCQDAGFAHVQTYIASGNVVFESKAPESKVKAELEKRLQAYAGKPMGVAVRTAAEMAAVVKANPFPKASPSQAVAIFLDKPPPSDALDHVVQRGPSDQVQAHRARTAVAGTMRIEERGAQRLGQFHLA